MSSGFLKIFQIIPTQKTPHFGVSFAVFGFTITFKKSFIISFVPTQLTLYRIDLGWLAYPFSPVLLNYPVDFQFA